MEDIIVFGHNLVELTLNVRDELGHRVENLLYSSQFPTLEDVIEAKHWLMIKRIL